MLAASLPGGKFRTRFRALVGLHRDVFELTKAQATLAAV
jgi:hypothetical protein